MATEHDSSAHSDAAAESASEVVALPEAAESEPSALETLTALVLDAADAANGSAQSATEAIAQLRSAVESNRDAATSLSKAPAIFGAVTLGIGVIMAVMVAIFVTRVGHETEALQTVVNKQSAQLKQTEAALKQLAAFQDTLDDFKNVASDATQRAMVLLREQVKADRLALQQLEVRRMEEVIRSAGGAMQGNAQAADKGLLKVEAKLDELAGSKGLLRVEGKLDELARAVARASQPAPAPGKAVDSSKETKALQEQVAQLRADIAALKVEVIRSQEAMAQKQGVPTFRKTP